MNRDEKLKKLKEAKASSDMVIISNGEPFIEVLTDRISELKKVLGSGVELNNLDDLLEQLELVQSFQQEVKSLKEAIKGITLPNSVEVTGLGSLVKAVEVLSQRKDPEFPQIKEELFTDISKSITELTLKVEAAAVPPKAGQLPSDYVPMRRVVKVGSKLYYDDSQYTGGGGGGSASDGILSGVVYDYVGFTNADGNGNYQTITYKSGGSGGATRATLTYTFDGSNNVTSITRS